MHHHNHNDHITANQKRLLVALSITLLMTVVEFVGGILSNSLALIGDAAHMLTDTLAMGLSIFALNLAKRPANKSKTYGYLRAEIMAALTNGTILILICIYIFYESYHRFTDPPEVEGSLMLGVAIVGLLSNLFGIWILRSASHHNLNVKGAYLHMWGDTISSLGVIGGSIVIMSTGWYYADPLISVLIGVLILKGALGLIWESSNILLEAVPGHLDMNLVIATITRIDGVVTTHDVHLWTITSGVHAISGHLLIEDQMVSRSAQIIEEVNYQLSHKFNIKHCTLQLECGNRQDSLICQVDPHQH